MAADTDGLRVLIVDDVVSPRTIISKMLVAMGVRHIEEASDGNEALNLLEKTSFDLVISDWNMHPMDGLQLLEIIRNRDDLKHLPFIMITATAQKDEVFRACSSGVTSYIIKPFNLKVLQSTVSKYLVLPGAES